MVNFGHIDELKHQKLNITRLKLLYGSLPEQGITIQDIRFNTLWDAISKTFSLMVFLLIINLHIYRKSQLWLNVTL